MFPLRIKKSYPRNILAIQSDWCLGLVHTLYTVAIIHFSLWHSPSGSVVQNQSHAHPALCARPCCYSSFYACTCTVLQV